MFKRGLSKTSPWRLYQKAQWMIVLFNLGVVAAAILIAALAPAFLESNIFLAVAGCLIAITNVAAGYYLGNFACPRCRQPFFRNWKPVRFEPNAKLADPRTLPMVSGKITRELGQGRLTVNLRQNSRFARTCRNCGLPRWQDA